jgi:hypothetical protein
LDNKITVSNSSLVIAMTDNLGCLINPMFESLGSDFNTDNDTGFLRG